ncbi:pterin-4a-carbinolamine dehydratase [Lipingzhangella halophila]|uniref:Putative pterin-4-alpha-carbinolamine dehydratase n=1 Tax=Lipingzhangella halophila TaxID=1783352 RepID=A0A7W7RKG6_9ACTN|nr:DUF2267 domain-containing protein [Lipingzhangella halophila]MBB4933606.1 pterin-4a-carbinolamine dehydratase [Lipingzhangella halophila]
MIAHQELVDRVAAREGISGADDARQAVQSVLTVLAPHVGSQVRARLAETLPASLVTIPEGDRPGAAAESGDLALEVARAMDCPPERGLHLARLVLSEIGDAAPDLGAELAKALPEELAEWAGDPVGAAGRADAGATGAPSRLDSQTVRTVLDRMPEWDGDTSGLTRVVRVPQDRLPPLEGRVDRVGRELGHPAHRERVAGGVTFTVRTASVGAVTTRDVELAERIEQAIAEVGSGG